MNIAILASGKGSNFEALVNAIKKNKIKAKVRLLICDKKNAFVRRRAKKLNIKEILLEAKNFKSRSEFDKELIKILRVEKINLVILAGYMRILSPNVIKAFKNKILNIHPAILPSFKGVESIKRAFKYGCKLIGVTVHFVTKNVDAGPIILQDCIKITKTMTLAQAEKLIHKLEHKLYAKAVEMFVDKKIKIARIRVKDV